MKINSKFIIWNLDIFAVVGFLSAIFFSAQFKTTPVIQNTSLLLTIPAVFFLSILVTYKGLHSVFESPRLKFPRIAPSQLTYKLIIAVTLTAVVATLFSWALAIRENMDILHVSPIYGLRAITTSLHKLVPLESRVQFVLLPVAMLYPAPARNRFIERLLIFLLVLFTLATQTKIGYLFASAFLFYFLLLREKTYKKNLVNSCLKFIFIITLSFVGLKLINEDVGNAYYLGKTDKLKIETTVETPTPTQINESHKCSGDSTWSFGSDTESTDTSSLKLMTNRLMIRTLDTPVSMLRLFICLREDNWRPNFRGHQLFRLVHKYVPYYRLAYEAYRPGHGNIISSAVTNTAADSYFNMGFTGVVLSGIVLAFIWAILKLVSSQLEYFSLLIFIKIYLAEIITQLSILSALVTVFPLLCILGFDFILAHYKKRKANVPS